MIAAKLAVAQAAENNQPSEWLHTICSGRLQMASSSALTTNAIADKRMARCSAISIGFLAGSQIPFWRPRWWRKPVTIGRQ